MRPRRPLLSLPAFWATTGLLCSACVQAALRDQSEAMEVRPRLALSRLALSRLALSRLALSRLALSESGSLRDQSEAMDVRPRLAFL